MPRLPLVAFAFLLSGSAALVYQVVWQRILTLHTGIGVVSVSLIVAAFMAGLGLGSHAGGALSARVSPGRALRLFAAIELGIGLFGLVSAPLYAHGLAVFSASLYRSPAGQALAHFLAFLLPTFLMGLSLPVLVRATVADGRSAARTIARLYGVNVLGAASGALLAPWVLVRFLGMEGACRGAATANLVAAAVALLAGAVPQGRERAPADAAPPAPALVGAPVPLGRWMLLYATSGFLALSLEIVWFRLIDVGVKSTAFTFGTVLCVFLLGLGGGSLLGSRLAPRLERPLEAFLDFQLALLAAAGATVVLLATLSPTAPLYAWFFEYWRADPFFQLGADWNPGTLARLYALLPLALYGLPTVLMGLSFGALHRAVQDDPATAGRKVGLLQAANIAGCTAGSLLTGLVLLERLGTAGTLEVLIVAGAAVFLLVRAAAAGLSPALVLRTAILASVIAALPTQQALWTRLHGVDEGKGRPARPSFVGEDASAVSAVLPGDGDHWRVAVNGLPHSWLPFDGIHTLLGAVPALVHPAPRSVAVVGLGSGETAWAVACRPETRAVRVFEIAGRQHELLRRVSAAAPLAGLVQLLEDPRVAIEVADGRQALARSAERYDLVQVDAMFRTSAGSGNLYSVEFFRLCASRLAPGGILCTQKPSRRVGLTFAEAVPHAIDFGNIVVGSNEALPVDPAAWEARLDRPEVAARFTAEVREGIRARLREARSARRNPDARIGLNHDLFPRDEFATPARDR
jgi:predicted membrane-bound spermidine synthase